MKNTNIQSIFAAALVAAAVCAPAQSPFRDFTGAVDAMLDAVRESREQDAAPTDVRAIFAKARESVEDGNVDFCGFYPGMSRADADALVAHYKLKSGEWTFEGDPVHTIQFTLHGVRRITKGGNTFDELAQAVANRVGDLKHNWDSDSYSMKTIDGVSVSMSDSGGLKMVNSSAKAEADRIAAEQAQRLAQERQERGISNLLSNMVQIPGKNCKMGKYEVTQAQWEAIMGKNPSRFKGPDNPVEQVSWDDCQKFLEKLNALPAVKNSGLTFRLPTDAEWETACRAGATGKYCLLADGTEITEETLGAVAWFKDNSDEQTHPVGRKTPNAFGLYDMHGNVEEWCQEEYGSVASWAKGKKWEHGRVSRGGCWLHSAEACESSNPYWNSPSFRRGDLGFRLCASGRDD